MKEESITVTYEYAKVIEQDGFMVVCDEYTTETKTFKNKQEQLEYELRRNEI